MKLGLGMSLRLQGRPFGGLDWTPAELPGVFGFYSAAEGLLDASGNQVTDGAEIQTWQDLSGNGNHLTAIDSSNRPTWRATGGPTGGPVVESLRKVMGRAALAATVNEPTIVILCRHRSADFTAGERIWTGDGTPVLDMRSNSLGTWRASVDAVNSGNLSIPNDQWLTHHFRAREGVAHHESLDDNQVRRVGSSFAATAQLDAFYLGGTNSGASRSNIDIVAVIGVAGGISEADMARLRPWASSQLGLSYSAEAELVDTFSRANTSDNNLGIGETRHRWFISGSGAANMRITDHALTAIAAPNAAYCWPETNFRPRVVEWYYEENIIGGGGFNSVNVYGTTRNRRDITDMIHFLWSPRSWRLERWFPSGGSAVIVAQRTTGAFEEPSGRYRLTYNETAGTITVLDPTGLETVCDWDGIIGVPLSEYRTPFLYWEIISYTDVERMIRILDVSATP